MFYEKQPQKQKLNYKKMLSIIGNLTVLFSESDCPYLPYRAHENIFCKYFYADNLARTDCSADARKDKIGIGLKTWMGQDDQKIAEFGKLRETFKDLSGIELVSKIAEYRNERIRITKNLHGIDEMIYHIVKRIPGSMQILEHAFDYIDIDNIKVISNKGNINNTYFTDGKHSYHFSVSKNTLFMLFNDMILLDSFDVEIMDDPYSYLMQLLDKKQAFDSIAEKDFTTKKICLRLYSEKNGNKFVPEKSGLNQWNGVRTSNRTKKDGTIVHNVKKRDPNELYIPYPAEDRNKTQGFFPDRNTIFELKLPDGKIMSAKVCQDDGKAIMSNPNNALGEWLLRNVFELPVGTVVTYEMLERFGIDSVVFTKHDTLKYSIDFSEIGTYENFNINKSSYNHFK